MQRQQIIKNLPYDPVYPQNSGGPPKGPNESATHLQDMNRSHSTH